MRKSRLILAAVGCAAFLALLITPQTRIHHQASTAFTASLDAAVHGLETGTRTAVGATAIMMNASAPDAIAGPAGSVTFNGQYTCATYANTGPGCPAPFTASPGIHTCANAYTCQRFTCDTYDPKQNTCDPNSPACPLRQQHTVEPPPLNHTCALPVCGPGLTFDQTLDPRAPTCDAGNPQCFMPTFNHNQTTCDPQLPQCRNNNPFACTHHPGNPTCQGPPSCPPPTTDPRAVTCDPGPNCSVTDIQRTTWGKVKSKYRK
ncbi:MAG TPA: hypothetical protein VEY91_11190 [Candidatus Limnocylindria bacterium]|nr:hypothetical protein [Candidatus Limnocylindria bacterium]